MSKKVNSKGYNLLKLTPVDWPRPANKELAKLKKINKILVETLDKVMGHLNNAYTSQNEALCLIRRDVEDAKAKGMST